MPSMVTAIVATGRNRIIDYNAGQACDVVIKVFTCIRTVWNRVRNMLATVLTTITTIWRPGLNYCLAVCLQDNSRAKLPTKVETKRKLPQFTVSAWLIMNGGESGGDKKKTLRLILHSI